MLELRKSEERGTTRLPWPNAKHTFSFGDYYDPRHRHFKHLRVINQDIVQPDQGFGMHPHQDMEILTYIIRGQLRHRDSMGNEGILRAGDIQRMSAGTGVKHSEFNASRNEELELLQIWIYPNHRGLPPSYEQVSVSSEKKKNRLCPVGSPEGKDGTVQIHQDVRVYSSILEKEKNLSYAFEKCRRGWVQVISGELLVADQSVKAGDGLAINGIEKADLKAVESCEFLLFDMGH